MPGCRSRFASPRAWVAAAVTVLSATAAGRAGAAVIASYPFNSGSANSTDTDPTSTAGAFTKGVFTGGDATKAGVSNSTNMAFYRSDASSATTDAAAVTNDDSFGFTLTPTVGPTSLSSLTFDYGGNSVANGTNYTANFVVRSSLDGFASNIGTTLTKTVNSTTSSFNQAVVDLTGAQFQNLTSPVTFKIFEFDASVDTGNIARVDNVILNGVPEPSTAALVAAAAATTLFRRRRHRAAR